MIALLQDNLNTLIATIVTGFFTWFFARRKQNAEVTTTEIDNGSKIVGLYKDSLDDLGKRYEEKYNHVEQMSKNISDLFDAKEKTLLQEIEYHKKQTALYKKMYDDKNREFIKYKKEHP